MAKRVLQNKRVMAVPLEDETVVELERIAAMDGLTVNSYVRMVLMRHVRFLEKEERDGK